MKENKKKMETMKRRKIGRRRKCVERWRQGGRGGGCLEEGIWEREGMREKAETKKVEEKRKENIWKKRREEVMSAWKGKVMKKRRRMEKGRRVNTEEGGEKEERK